MDNTVCHFEIPVDDLEQARKFYCGVFGWTISTGNAHGEEYLFVRTAPEPGAVGGGLLKRIDPQHGVTVYFAVESVKESAQKIEELGGKIVLPKTAIAQIGWLVTARDPQGNLLGLFQADPQAA
jgi:uncharacterized protein